MRISRSTGAFSGLLLIVLGLWGGLVPFIGPYFHYAFGSTTAWHYTADRLWLDILPGAAVVLGGFGLMSAGHRISGGAAGWLAIVGGAWFAIGPAVSRVWEHGAGPIGAPLYGTTRQMLELVGYFYGLGALIVALAAFALGRFVTRPALVAEPETAIPLDPVPAAPAAQPATVTPPPATVAQPATMTQPPAAAAQPATADPSDISTVPTRPRSLGGRRRGVTPSDSTAPRPSARR